MKLSILDQSMIVSGHSAREAINQTIALAESADQWGYHRYWLAEHHGMQGLADTCPEVLLARIGATTKRIRIGSGGVMLPYYAPFKVAEQFMMLEALFPGRIDLGLGRAPGGDRIIAAQVAGGHYDGGANFPAQVQALINALDDNVSEVILQPKSESKPQVWMLGSSEFGGALAAKLGLPFTFAHFISAHGGDLVTQAYRQQFTASKTLNKPYCAVAVFAICADTQDEADALASAVDLRRVQMAYGVNAPIPTIAEAAREAQHYTTREHQIIEQARARSLIGTPDTVKWRIEAIAKQYAADEVIVLSVCGSYAARHRTYELLAKAFNLADQK